MRETEASIWVVRSSTRALLCALRLSAVALGIGLIMVSGVARAQDGDEEDDKTFEEKIIENILGGLGATNMENKGIDYRERSPLVVPPKLELPPPASANAADAPNWPKDPDEARRRAAIEARKKEKKKDIVEDSRPLSPSEMNVGRIAARPRTSNDPVQPGVSNNPILSPAQLGFTGGLSKIFGGSNKPETAPFTSEPTRETLTQPPPGYQTPSPNFAYGTGPKESLNKVYDPSRGKYGE
ncbi:MAG TPA: hypothetical protein VII39_03250 [Bradyrhizobium sp.]